MRMTRLPGLVGSVALLLALTGCTSLPAFDTAREEARADMQSMVALLPVGAVVRVDDPIPQGYVSCDGGVQYTGRWLIHLADPSTVEDSVAEMRRKAPAEDFVEDDFLENRDVRFGVRRGGDADAPLVGVSADEGLDGLPYVEIMSFARCSQSPEGTEMNAG